MTKTSVVPDKRSAIRNPPNLRRSGQAQRDPESILLS